MHGGKSLAFVEQPVEKYKSRYLSEGKKHGELLGRNACAQTKKSYPKLQIKHPHEFQVSGKIDMELIYFKNGNEMPHPNLIVVDGKHQPERTKSIGFHVDRNSDWIVPLEGIRMFKRKRSEVEKFVRDCRQNLTDECNDDEIQKEATYTRQSDVYLKCTVWLSNEGRYINCGSVTSERISQLSQPNDLIILNGIADENRVWLICNKVKKRDIEVYFLRKDASSENFFRIAKAVIDEVLTEKLLMVETPKYTFRNERIDDTTDLKIQLYRPSDKVSSDLYDVFKKSHKRDSVSPVEPIAKKRKLSQNGRGRSSQVPVSQNSSAFNCPTSGNRIASDHSVPQNGVVPNHEIFQKGNAFPLPSSRKGGAPNVPMSQNSSSCNSTASQNGGASDIPLSQNCAAPNPDLFNLSMFQNSGLLDIPISQNRCSPNSPISENGASPNVPMSQNRCSPNFSLSRKDAAQNLPMIENKLASNVPVSRNGGTPNAPMAQNGGTSNYSMSQNGGTPNLPMSQNGGTPNLPMSQNGGTPNLPMSQNDGIANLPLSQNGDAPNVSVSQNGSIPNVPMTQNGGTSSVPMSQKDIPNLPMFQINGTLNRLVSENIGAPNLPNTQNDDTRNDQVSSEHPHRCFSSSLHDTQLSTQQITQQPAESDSPDIDILDIGCNSPAKFDQKCDQDALTNPSLNDFKTRAFTNDFDDELLINKSCGSSNVKSVEDFLEEISQACLYSPPINFLDPTLLMPSPSSSNGLKTSDISDLWDSWD